MLTQMELESNEKPPLCYSNTTGTYTSQWLEHVYDSAWAYYKEYDKENDDEEITCDSEDDFPKTGIPEVDDQPKCYNHGQAALAFAYGYLTHAAGDVWAHTIVNEYADGVFPGVAEIANNSTKSDISIRHLVVEGYFAAKTPHFKISPIEK